MELSHPLKTVCGLRQREYDGDALRGWKCVGGQCELGGDILAYKYEDADVNTWQLLSCRRQRRQVSEIELFNEVDF